MTVQDYTKALCDLPGGREVQIRHAIQEMAELTVELTKELDGEGEMRQIREEVADVHLMLAQLIEIFGFSRTELFWMQEDKMRRTFERKGMTWE